MGQLKNRELTKESEFVPTRPLQIIDAETEALENQFENVLHQLTMFRILLSDPRVRRDVRINATKMAEELEREITASLDWGILIK
tara:strand:- start:588 stop:842 length:255 start_codon:yes stop_codon:yes gene_type:complete